MTIRLLDLFSGIGGMTLALRDWCHTVAYCEIDRYCQQILSLRMRDGVLPHAPVFSDVTTLRGADLPCSVDIITAGFPCQDISVAGTGAGLAGQRSGLFWEVARLVGELRPQFVYLENVPAITGRGGPEVVGALTALGYDCRWCVVSAGEIGAPHKRDRWWLLAHASGVGRSTSQKDSNRINQAQAEEWQSQFDRGCSGVSKICDSKGQRLAQWEGVARDYGQEQPPFMRAGWWAAEPSLGRVANGIPKRVDRIRALGNAVVPLQARTAFQYLISGRMSDEASARGWDHSPGG